MLQLFESNSSVNFEHSDGNRRFPAYIIIQAFHHIVCSGKPQTDTTQHGMFLLPFNSYFLFFLSFGPTENTRNPFFFFFFFLCP